ncbi:MAG TPA: hypothetical protein VEU06_07720 [Micropepsaceae bacterium]|jgi:hypothetical protein|nr:hypothetical protein [Micropepsaceae bacterium]
MAHVTESHPSRTRRKYRFFFIGYLAAWFFAGIAIELIRPWRISPAAFGLRLKPPTNPVESRPA